jgi:hypothetical protein
MNPSLKRQEGRETLMEAKKVFEKEQPEMAEIEGKGFGKLTGAPDR